MLAVFLHIIFAVLSKFERSLKLLCAQQKEQQQLLLPPAIWILLFV